MLMISNDSHNLYFFSIWKDTAIDMFDSFMMTPRVFIILQF